jgi:hypothetical protein
MPQNSMRQKTTFITSLILSCLGTAGIELKKQIRSGCVSFLLEQRSATWSWNYWARRDHKSSQKQNIPDDLDDTFAALIALHFQSPELITGDAMSAIRGHARSDGPFQTWIMNGIPNSQWNNIDPVVNASVAYFFAIRNVCLPNTEAYLEKILIGEKYESRYYFNDTSILYFISRLYGLLKLQTNGSQRAIQKLLIIANRNLTSNNKQILEAALALSAIINFEVPQEATNTLQQLAEKILSSEWKMEGLYIEAIHKGVPIYAGSEAMTAAFCIEALTKYEKY